VGYLRAFTHEGKELLRIRFCLTNFDGLLFICGLLGLFFSVEYEILKVRPHFMWNGMEMVSFSTVRDRSVRCSACYLPYVSMDLSICMLKISNVQDHHCQSLHSAERTS
jgi:hypothetical protein